MIEQIVTSSILIAAILILSFFMEKRINPCVKYALWLLVAVKLLVPFPEFQSNLSVMNLANRIEQTEVRYLFVENAPEEKLETPIRGTTGGSVPHKTEAADIFSFVRTAGMLLCAGLFAWGNLRFSRKVRKSRVPVGRYQNKLNVYTAAGLASPCLFGLFRPSIYLQRDRELSGEQKEYVFAHEYVHYRHGDHVWALVRCACVILYWYHPLVWLAACASIKDSELACDWGTLKLVGKENYREYGKTLIEIAAGISRPSKYHVLACSTGATGGGKELKKRMRMIVKQPRTKLVSLVILLFVCICIAGCTFGSAVVPVDAGDAGDTEDAPPAATPTAAVQPPEPSMSQEAILYEQPEADQVCIRVEPPVLRERLSYFYIPSEEAQERLIPRVEALNLTGEPFARRWEGKKETGWQLYYNDLAFLVFEGGYLYYTYTDETGIMECLIEDPELCGYIQNMLQEELGYYRFDPAKIENIRSAKLEIGNRELYYTQTVTDVETLKKFENWFSGAEYIFGGADCMNQCACLELTLDSGEVVRLSMAADSCSNFAINGVYYDYRPTADWDNIEFFGCFDEIPWEW